jgi:hypothetical protein
MAPPIPRHEPGCEGYRPPRRRGSRDSSGRRPDDIPEANCLGSLTSRRKFRSGAASRWPPDAGRISLSARSRKDGPHAFDEDAREWGPRASGTAHTSPLAPWRDHRAGPWRRPGISAALTSRLQSRGFRLTDASGEVVTKRLAWGRMRGVARREQWIHRDESHVNGRRVGPTMGDTGSAWPWEPESPVLPGLDLVAQRSGGQAADSRERLLSRPG